jgi:hypothetical protein
MKICKKCDIPKEFSEFPKKVSNKDGLNTLCKKCFNLHRKEYLKNYNLKNKDTLDNYKKNYYLTNKDELNSKSKMYYLSNSDELKRKSLENKKINKEDPVKYKIIKDKRNTYEINRRKTDILYGLSYKIRNVINQSLKNKNYTKRSNSQEILGCSYEHFRLYIEGKFEPWMTWENRGLYNGEFNYGWDIDHIIPLSTAKTEEEILKLNHYSNFQPLCSKINRDVKRDIYETY